MSDNGNPSDPNEPQLPPSWGQAPPTPATPPGHQPGGYGQEGPGQQYGQQQNPYGQAYNQYGQQYAGPPQPLETEGSATTVLVLGIVSIVFTLSCGIGFIPAIIALIMAPKALANIEASNGTKGGESLVNAGRICAFVSLGLSAALLLLFLLFVGLAFLPLAFLPMTASGY